MKRLFLASTLFLIANISLATAAAHLRAPGFNQSSDSGGGASNKSSKRDEEIERKREKKAKELYKQGVKFGLSGKYLDAVEAFKQTLALDPKNADAFFGLGHAYSDLGRWIEAIEAYSQAVRLNPQDAEAFHMMGIAYFKLNSYEKAIEAFKQAVLIKPRLIEARYNIANAFHKLKRFEPAIVYYTEVLNLKHNFADAHNDLGTAYAELGRYQEAAKAFKKAADLNSDDPFAHNNLGLAYYYQGMQEESAKAFKRALRLAPDNKVIQENLNLTSQPLQGRTAVGVRVSVVNAGSNAAEGDGKPNAVGRWLSRSDFVREIGGKESPTASNSLIASISPASGTPSLKVRNSTGPTASDETTAGPTKDETAKTKEQTSHPNNNAAKPSNALSASDSLSGKAPLLNVAGNNTATIAPSQPDTVPAKTEQSAINNASNNVSAPTSNMSAINKAATVANNSVAPNTSTAANANSLSPIDLYRVGVGDVLDVRLLNAPTNSSTLYTVLAGGLLDYPLTGEPLQVSDKTTDEIEEIIASQLKRRAIYDDPKVIVSVREYSSHTVIISGLVNDPGTKVLRREAVPLYVVLADAQPTPEAGRAAITSRKTGETKTVDINDAAAMTTLVYAGDVINVAAKQRQFYFIAGQVNDPGQKEFHQGLTLTQAILAAGGLTRSSAKIVEVRRQSADGRLITTSHVLKDIKTGEIPDPKIQPGDRIEVVQ